MRFMQSQIDLSDGMRPDGPSNLRALLELTSRLTTRPWLSGTAADGVLTQPKKDSPARRVATSHLVRPTKRTIESQHFLVAAVLDVPTHL